VIEKIFYSVTHSESQGKYSKYVKLTSGILKQIWHRMRAILKLLTGEFLEIEGCKRQYFSYSFLNGNFIFL
jgi:hypothetical protein